FNAAPFCEIRTEDAFVAANAVPLTAVERGKEAVMATNFEAPRAFEGEAVATLVGVPDTIQIAPIKVTKDTKEMRFNVVTTEASPVGKKENLFVQVEIPVGNGASIHRIALGSSLRIDAPRKAAPVAKAAPAAAPKAAAPAAPAPVVLSRLEQLRQEKAGAKN
ncbi:MAG: hypothetical protein ACKOY8_08400, partial [Verrucomicrobiota bacterium]